MIPRIPQPRPRATAFGITLLAPDGRVLLRLAETFECLPDPAMLRRAETAPLEVEIQRDGIPLRCYLAPLRPPAGELWGYVLVTRRIDLEEALLEGERRYRQIVETTHEGIWIIDPESRTTFVNAQMARMLGYSPEEMLGMSMYDFIGPGWRAVAARNVERRRHGIEEQHDFTFLRKDGTDLHALLDTNPLFDEAGRYAGSLAMVSDITARKKMEQQLEEAQRLAQLGSWEWDLASDHITWSAELYRIYGLTPETFGGTYADFLARNHPDDRQRVDALIREGLETHRPMAYEHRILRPDGAIRLLRSRNQVQLGADGQVVRMFGICQDVTETVETEREMARRAAELEKARAIDRMKNAFVSSVSHELRTPLSSIIGYAEFLEDELAGTLNEAQRGYVQQLQAGARRLQNLVDDLLDFSRLEAGTFRLKRRPASLRAKIQEVTGSLWPLARERLLELKAETGEDPLDLEMDPDRVGQVLLNLINNALKFTPAGGSVSVTAHRAADEVRVEVRDTGIGIAPEHQSKLFERFFQVDDGLTRRQGGAGLGLAISKAIIEAHGGRIGVNSQQGEGSTFWFTLPTKPGGD